MREGIGPEPDQLNLGLNEGEIQVINPEDEKKDPQSFEVLQVPSVANENYATSRRELKDDPKSILEAEKKLIYLESLVEGYDDEAFSDILQTLREQFEAYKKRISKYKDAPDTSATIPARMEKIKKIGEGDEDNEKAISGALKDDFETNPGNKICLADSHVLTIYNLTEAFKARTDKDAKVAVMVFDNHIDIYDHADDDWKGNVFQKLFETKVIDRATFIGGNSEPGLIDRQNEKLAGPDKKAFDQISADDIRTNGKIDRPGLVQSVKDTIEEYKKEGITSLVFSVDVDVLRVKEMGYTAMEYTPMNFIGYVGSLDLPMDKKFDDLTRVEQAEIKAWMEIGRPSRSGPTRYSPGGDPAEIFDPQGMKLGDIGVALDTMAATCKKTGIDLGIQLTGGGKYLGDVVELTGPDIGERTTRATSALLKRINKISDSLPTEEESSIPTEEEPPMAMAA